MERCRFCGEENPEPNFNALQHIKLNNWIKRHFEVNLEDGLSSILCGECMANTHNFVTFRSQIKGVQKNHFPGPAFAIGASTQTEPSTSFDAETQTDAKEPVAGPSKVVVREVVRPRSKAIKRKYETDEPYVSKNISLSLSKRRARGNRSESSSPVRETRSTSRLQRKDQKKEEESRRDRKSRSARKKRNKRQKRKSLNKKVTGSSESDVSADNSNDSDFNPDDSLSTESDDILFVTSDESSGGFLSSSRSSSRSKASKSSSRSTSESPPRPTKKQIRRIESDSSLSSDEEKEVVKKKTINSSKQVTSKNSPEAVLKTSRNFQEDLACMFEQETEEGEGDDEVTPAPVETDVVMQDLSSQEETSLQPEFISVEELASSESQQDVALNEPSITVPLSRASPTTVDGNKDDEKIAEPTKVIPQKKLVHAIQDTSVSNEGLVASTKPTPNLASETSGVNPRMASTIATVVTEPSVIGNIPTTTSADTAISETVVTVPSKSPTAPNVATLLATPREMPTKTIAEVPIVQPSTSAAAPNIPTSITPRIISSTPSEGTPLPASSSLAPAAVVSTKSTPDATTQPSMVTVPVIIKQFLVPVSSSKTLVSGNKTPSRGSSPEIINNEESDIHITSVEGGVQIPKTPEPLPKPKLGLVNISKLMSPSVKQSSAQEEQEKVIARIQAQLTNKQVIVPPSAAEKAKVILVKPSLARPSLSQERPPVSQHQQLRVMPQVRQFVQNPQQNVVNTQHTILLPQQHSTSTLMQPVLTQLQQPIVMQNPAQQVILQTVVQQQPAVTSSITLQQVSRPTLVQQVSSSQPLMQINQSVVAPMLVQQTSQPTLIQVSSGQPQRSVVQQQEVVSQPVQVSTNQQQSLIAQLFQQPQQKKTVYQPVSSATVLTSQPAQEQTKRPVYQPAISPTVHVVTSQPVQEQIRTFVYQPVSSPAVLATQPVQEQTRKTVNQPVSAPTVSVVTSQPALEQTRGPVIQPVRSQAITTQSLQEQHTRTAHVLPKPATCSSSSARPQVQEVIDLESSNPSPTISNPEETANNSSRNNSVDPRQIPPEALANLGLTLEPAQSSPGSPQGTDKEYSSQVVDNINNYESNNTLEKSNVVPSTTSCSTPILTATLAAVSTPPVYSQANRESPILPTSSPSLPYNVQCASSVNPPHTSPGFSPHLPSVSPSLPQTQNRTSPAQIDPKTQHSTSKPRMPPLLKLTPEIARIAAELESLEKLTNQIPRQEQVSHQYQAQNQVFRAPQPLQSTMTNNVPYTSPQGTPVQSAVYPTQNVQATYAMPQQATGNQAHALPCTTQDYKAAMAAEQKKQKQYYQQVQQQHPQQILQHQAQQKQQYQPQQQQNQQFQHQAQHNQQYQQQQNQQLQHQAQHNQQYQQQQNQQLQHQAQRNQQYQQQQNQQLQHHAQQKQQQQLQQLNQQLQAQQQNIQIQQQNIQTRLQQQQYLLDYENLQMQQKQMQLQRLQQQAQPQQQQPVHHGNVPNPIQAYNTYTHSSQPPSYNQHLSNNAATQGQSTQQIVPPNPQHVQQVIQQAPRFEQPQNFRHPVSHPSTSTVHHQPHLPQAGPRFPHITSMLQVSPNQYPLGFHQSSTVGSVSNIQTHSNNPNQPSIGLQTDSRSTSMVAHNQVQPNQNSVGFQQGSHTSTAVVNYNQVTTNIYQVNPNQSVVGFQQGSSNATNLMHSQVNPNHSSVGFQGSSSNFPVMTSDQVNPNEPSLGFQQSSSNVSTVAHNQVNPLGFQQSSRSVPNVTQNQVNPSLGFQESSSNTPIMTSHQRVHNQDPMMASQQMPPIHQSMAVHETALSTNTSQINHSNQQQTSSDRTVNVQNSSQSLNLNQEPTFSTNQTVVHQQEISTVGNVPSDNDILNRKIEMLQRRQGYIKKLWTQIIDNEATKQEFLDSLKNVEKGVESLRKRYENIIKLQQSSASNESILESITTFHTAAQLIMLQQLGLKYNIQYQTSMVILNAQKQVTDVAVRHIEIIDSENDKILPYLQHLRNKIEIYCNHIKDNINVDKVKINDMKEYCKKLETAIENIKIIKEVIIKLKKCEYNGSVVEISIKLHSIFMILRELILYNVNFQVYHLELVANSTIKQLTTTNDSIKTNHANLLEKIKEINNMKFQITKEMCQNLPESHLSGLEQTLKSIYKYMSDANAEIQYCNALNNKDMQGKIENLITSHTKIHILHKETSSLILKAKKFCQKVLNEIGKTCVVTPNNQHTSLPELSPLFSIDIDVFDENSNMHPFQEPVRPSEETSIATVESDTVTQRTATVESDSVTQRTATVESDTVIQRTATVESDTITQRTATEDNRNDVLANAETQNLNTYNNNNIVMVSSSDESLSPVADFEVMETPMKCTLCEATFTDFNKLVDHRADHDFAVKGKRQYLLNKRYKNNKTDIMFCRFCTKKTKSKAFMERHVIKHLGINPFQCVKCDKSFPNKLSLRTHNYVHTGIKPFVCNLCDKRYLCHGGLKSHTLNIHKEPDLPCYECGEKFMNPSKLKSHLKIVHNKKFKRKSGENVCQQLPLYQFSSTVTQTKKTPLEKIQNIKDLEVSSLLVQPNQEISMNLGSRTPKRLQQDILFETPYCKVSINTSKLNQQTDEVIRMEGNEQNSSATQTSSRTISNVASTSVQHKFQMHRYTEQITTTTTKQPNTVINTSVKHTLTNDFASTSQVKSKSEENLSQKSVSEEKVRRKSFEVTRKLSLDMPILDDKSTDENSIELCNDKLTTKSNEEVKKVRKRKPTHNPNPEHLFKLGKFKCKFCPNKEFEENSTYVAHMSLHNKDHRFKCDKCDATFISNSELLLHSKIHSTLQSVKQNIGNKSSSTITSKNTKVDEKLRQSGDRSNLTQNKNIASSKSVPVLVNKSKSSDTTKMSTALLKSSTSSKPVSPSQQSSLKSPPRIESRNERSLSISSNPKTSNASSEVSKPSTSKFNSSLSKSISKSLKNQQTSKKECTQKASSSNSNPQNLKSYSSKPSSSSSKPSSPTSASSSKRESSNQDNSPKINSNTSKPKSSSSSKPSSPTSASSSKIESSNQDNSPKINSNNSKPKSSSSSKPSSPVHEFSSKSINNQQSRSGNKKEISPTSNATKSNISDTQSVSKSKDSSKSENISKPSSSSSKSSPKTQETVTQKSNNNDLEVVYEDRKPTVKHNTNRKTYDCYKCTSFTTFSKNKCDIHKAKHKYLDFNAQIKLRKKKSSFPCMYCENNFDYCDSLQLHFDTVHKKTHMYSCHDCSMKFRKEEPYNDHVKMHETSGQFICVHCLDDFNSQTRLERHINIKHS